MGCPGGERGGVQRTRRTHRGGKLDDGEGAEEDEDEVEEEGVHVRSVDLSQSVCGKENASISISANRPHSCPFRPPTPKLFHLFTALPCPALTHLHGVELDAEEADADLEVAGHDTEEKVEGEDGHGEHAEEGEPLVELCLVVWGNMCGWWAVDLLVLCLSLVRSIGEGVSHPMSSTMREKDAFLCCAPG